MLTPKRNIVQVIFDERTHQFLQIVAQSEDRSLSNMCRVLIKEALAARVHAGKLVDEMGRLKEGDK